MTPSFIGLIATMLPGVRPSMSLASLPTASTRPFTLLIATMDGSLTTIPLPRAYTHVLAVPRSMARSLENNDSIERRLKTSRLLRELAHRLLIGRSGRRLDTVLPAVLDLIHRGVGRVDEFVGRVGNVGKGRDADRGGEMEV